MDRRIPSRLNLICIDGSKNSERALLWYHDHYHRKGDTVGLLHLYIPPALGNLFTQQSTQVASYQRDIEALVSKAKHVTESFRRKCVEFNIPNEFIQIFTEAVVESAGKTICRIAQEKKASVLVLSQSGILVTGDTKNAVDLDAVKYVSASLTIPTLLIPELTSSLYNRSASPPPPAPAPRMENRPNVGNGIDNRAAAGPVRGVREAPPPRYDPVGPSRPSRAPASQPSGGILSAAMNNPVGPAAAAAILSNLASTAVGAASTGPFAPGGALGPPIGGPPAPPAILGNRPSLDTRPPPKEAGRPPYTIFVFSGTQNPPLNENDLAGLFSDFGPVGKVDLHLKKGFAFLHMDNYWAAEKAVKNLNGYTPKSWPKTAKPLQVKFKSNKVDSRPPPKDAEGPPFIVYVFSGNSNPPLNGNDLAGLFSEYGFVEKVDINHQKGYGFVHFENYWAAQKAIKNFDGYVPRSWPKGSKPFQVKFKSNRNKPEAPTPEKRTNKEPTQDDRKTGWDNI